MGETELVVVGIAGVVGTLAGVWITAWYNSRDLRIQLVAERNNTLLQLRHDKLVALLDHAASIYLYPPEMIDWKPERRAEFFKRILALEKHLGIASAFPDVFRLVVAFLNRVRTFSPAILKAYGSKNGDDFSVASDLWSKNVGAALNALDAAVNSAIRRA